jgi:hypothetical protein
MATTAVLSIAWAAFRNSNSPEACAVYAELGVDTTDIADVMLYRVPALGFRGRTWSVRGE